MLGEDVVAFLHSRPISMLCTRDAENRPAAHECLLAEVTPDWVIGLVPEHLAGHLPENVANNGEAALLVSRQPGDHRSVQVKGRITALEPPRGYAEEIAPALERLLPMFAAYFPKALALARVEQMGSQLFFRVKLDVAQVFDQTPGPGAGRPIGGAD